MDEAGDTTQNTEPKTDTPWKFSAGESTPNDVEAPQLTSQPSASESVKWTASEFIEHAKGSEWYLALGGGGLVLAGAIYLLTQDVISTIMTAVALIAFGVLAARKPRELDYEISNTGVKIGPKFYPYATFKSFAVVNEEAVESIWLMPLKRFMPIITIYFPPDNGEKIVNAISKYLPVQNHQLDPVDRLMHKLRF